MRSSLLVVGLTVGVISACTIASPTHITVQPTKNADGTDPKTDTSATEPKGEASGGEAVTCSGDDFTKPDLEALTPCGDGKGHCYDRAKTPTADQLVACADPNEVCVPDEILTAGGGTLDACKVQALGGATGACLTASLYPTIIAQGGDALKQDVCAAGQLCVPCNDPTHGNAPTPFCDRIGVHESACGNAAAAPDAAAPLPIEECCTTNGVSNGICIDESAIPESKRSKTIKDTCKRAKNKCVPRAMVENNPVTCDGGTLGKGVCMDKCFNSMMGVAGSIGALGTEGCGETEVCVPCFYAGKDVPGCN